MWRWRIVFAAKPGEPWRDTRDDERAFTQFECDRKPRVERIVAERRHWGNDKKIVTPIQSKMRNVMLAIVLNLVGERGQDWLYRYNIEWNDWIPSS